MLLMWIGSDIMFIVRYINELKKQWNGFLSKTKNSHFFFYRDYMEYHQERFQDFSLMVYNDKNNIVALLPANIIGDEVISHGGLTFGGLLVDNKMTVAKMLEVFETVVAYLRQQGVKRFIYKRMPTIYHRYPADEDLYTLFRNDAILYRRDVSETIYLPQRIKYKAQRKTAVKKGYANHYQLQQSQKYDEYVELLDAVLSKHYGSHPVHTTAELKLLAERFPDNIKLYTAEKDGRIFAGTVIFEQGQVAHTQYMANSEEGRKNGALDCLIDWLITGVYKNKTWFDFGISNEQQGRYLNEGLAAQKEGFGARAVVHDFYRLDLC